MGIVDLEMGSCRAMADKENTHSSDTAVTELRWPSLRYSAFAA